jgi:amylosucrase
VIEAVPTLPEHAGWITYVRCHDDIGWQPLAPQAGTNAASVQRRLRKISDFYTEGGSFARGVAFQSGAGSTAHGINGMAASLVGIETAATEAETAAVIARLLLLHGVAFAAGGIPLLYMGDELGQTNDVSFLDDPAKAHEGRWLHRPVFSEAAAASRSDAATIAGRVFAGMRALAFARQGLPALTPETQPKIIAQSDPAVLVFSRGPLTLAAFNFSDGQRLVALPQAAGWRAILAGQTVESDTVTLPPWGMAWLTAEAG